MLIFLEPVETAPPRPPPPVEELQAPPRPPPPKEDVIDYDREAEEIFKQEKNRGTPYGASMAAGNVPVVTASRPIMVSPCACFESIQESLCNVCEVN